LWGKTLDIFINFEQFQTNGSGSEQYKKLLIILLQGQRNLVSKTVTEQGERPGIHWDLILDLHVGREPMK
jgi:hypothetical protein